MTTTHTPGPWEVKPLEKNKPYLRVRGTQLGCRFKVCNVHMEHPDIAGDAVEAEANARLIATSPTMYDYIADRAKEGDERAKAIIASIGND